MQTLEGAEMFSMEVVSYIKILFYRSSCHHFQSLVKMVKYVIMWQLNLKSMADESTEERGWISG